jgi:hypothetical protein
VTLGDALAAWNQGQEGDLAILDSGPTDATAAVTRDGEVVEMLSLRRWDQAGGWFVERGADCLREGSEGRR